MVRLQIENGIRIQGSLKRLVFSIAVRLFFLFVGWLICHLQDIEAFGVFTPENIPAPVRNVLGLKVEGVEYKKQPAFDFIAVDDKVLVARGAGGGVALWVREEE